MKLKTSSLLSLSALAVLFVTASCHKKNDAPAAAGQLSATVGSNSFQPSLVVAIDVNDHIGIAGLQIKGSDSVLLTVFVPDTAKAGQAITISYDGDAAITYSNNTGTLVYSSIDPRAHGTVTASSIDKANKKIAGSFTGVIYSATNTNDSLKVSGQFNTSYIQQ